MPLFSARTATTAQSPVRSTLRRGERQSRERRSKEMRATPPAATAPQRRQLHHSHAAQPLVHHDAGQRAGANPQAGEALGGRCVGRGRALRRRSRPAPDRLESGALRRRPVGLRRSNGGGSGRRRRHERDVVVAVVAGEQLVQQVHRRNNTCVAKKDVKFYLTTDCSALWNFNFSNTFLRTQAIYVTAVVAGTERVSRSAAC